MADQLFVNGVELGLEAVAAPAGGYGEIYVVSLDWGTPDAELFFDPRPLADGRSFQGSRAQDRRFTLGLAIDEPGSYAKGQSTWEALLDLFRADEGPVQLKYIRTNPEGGSFTRELLVVPEGMPGYANVRGGGAGVAGIRPNGNAIQLWSLVAPFPWWRDVSVTATTTLTCSGTSPDSEVITRSGKRACGLEVKISTTGTLPSITLSDGQRTMVLTATFNATPKGVDWYYTDPTATSIDAGVVISIPAHLSLHSDPTTITATPGLGSSGTHTVTIKHRAIWEAP